MSKGNSLEKVIEYHQTSKFFRLGVFKKKIAIHPFNLSLNKGEVLGVIGGNGAGKSTLLKMTAGLLKPSSGHIVFAHSRPVMGYVPEKPSIMPFLTPESFLTCLGRFSAISTQEVSHQVDKALELVGLVDVRAARIEAFSKGMKQRLAIAQSVLHDPPVLLWDEPLSGLDPQARKEVLDIIQNIRDVEKDKVIILTTHEVDQVSPFCTGMLKVDNGEVFQYAE